jgi:hypothetical protein
MEDAPTDVTTKQKNESFTRNEIEERAKCFRGNTDKLEIRKI